LECEQGVNKSGNKLPHSRGCRYTPAMIEVLQKALELRAQGIIKF